MNNMRPIPPGEHLREEMKELALSARSLAAALRVPPNRVTGILSGTRAIADQSGEIAPCIYIIPSVEKWGGLQ